MKITRRSLLGLLGALALPVAPAAGQPSPQVDLARLYQRVEAAYARHAPLEPEARIRAGAEMDAVTRAFFMGGRGARKHLDGALLIITDDENSDIARFLVGLDAVVTSDDSGVTISLESSETGGDDDAAPNTGDLMVRVVAGDGAVIAEHAVIREEGGKLQTKAFGAAELPEGRHRIDVVSSCGREMTAGIWMLLHESLDPVRSELLRRADAVRDAAPENPHAAGHHGLLGERIAHLRNPPASDVTGWTLDLAKLRNGLLDEMTRYEAGEDPFADLTGEHWLRIPAGVNPIPSRVIVPPFDPEAPRRPLVIALHGAGGNEHLFPDGHGAGLLGRLAREEGFVVVSPHTQMMTRGTALPDMIEYLRDRAHIDPQRVSIIGHSMGGMAAIMLTGEFPEQIHRTVAIAGARPVPEPALQVPIWIVGAERDAIVQERMVRMAADASIERGAQVTYHMVPGADHLLVVADVLRDAIRFVLTR